MYGFLETLMRTPTRSPLQSLLGGYEQTAGALEQLHQQRLAGKLREQQLKQMPESERLKNMLMETQARNLMARTAALPQQQELSTALRRAQIAALTQKATPMGITAEGLPVMLPQVAAQQAAPVAPAPHPGVAPGVPGVAPEVPASAPSHPGVFLPSRIGATRTQVASYINPHTGEAISALTSQGRTKLQDMLRAKRQMIDVYKNLIKYGKEGDLGAPGFVPASLVPFKEAREEDRIGAPLYTQALMTGKDVFPRERGIQATVEALRTAQAALMRRPLETANAYVSRHQENISKTQDEISKIEQALAIAGIRVSKDAAAKQQPTEAPTPQALTRSQRENIINQLKAKGVL